MVKKSLLFVLLLLLIPFIASQNYKLEISTAKASFSAGENITLKVAVLNSENNPINDNVLVILEDAEKNIKVEQTIPSNKFIDISLGEKASYGQGKITAVYAGEEAINSFNIEINELAKFEIYNDILKITNIGNTQYTKTVQITIGDTTGIKNPKLDIGKSISYKLVAPEGTYSIKVTDGKTTITQGSVNLAGTGNIVGAIDESSSTRSPLTGTISPNEKSDEALLSYVKNSKFVYTFVLVIFGAMILLVIERRYRKKVSGG